MCKLVVLVAVLEVAVAVAVAVRLGMAVVLGVSVSWKTLMGLLTETESNEVAVLKDESHHLSAIAIIASIGVMRYFLKANDKGVCDCGIYMWLQKN